jgi:hypothetical protein
MKLIAHRGNISGPNKFENEPNYIQKSLDLGFDVEVDIRLIDSEWWLGHDTPQYKISSPSYIFDNSKIWWHCKNFAALEKLQGSSLNYFWHQEDDHTVTSKGFIWTYPGKDIGKKNIVVMPEMVMSLTEIYNLNCFGICSDYVQNINNNLKKEI